MKKRLVALLCAVALYCTMAIPSSAASIVYFTAVNDTLLPLSGDTMPVWYGNSLYVPYTVFDGVTSGIDFDIRGSYSASSGTVVLYNLRNMLVFDINEDSVYDRHTGQEFSSLAIVRNGQAFLPVSLVCSYFGLNYATILTDYGMLLRIDNGDATFDNDTFVRAAALMMERRLQDYQQSLVTVTPTTPDPPADPPTPAPSTTTTVQTPLYLGFRCGDDGGLDIAAQLTAQGSYGIFFFSPDDMTACTQEIRTLLITGHSIGILPQGETEAEIASSLAQGNALLATIANTRTTVVMCDETYHESLEASGWVCWNETAVGTPTPGADVSSFSTATVWALPTGSASVYLTLSTSTALADEFSSLLTQLSTRQFKIQIPLETNL